MSNDRFTVGVIVPASGDGTLSLEGRIAKLEKEQRLDRGFLRYETEKKLEAYRRIDILTRDLASVRSERDQALVALKRVAEKCANAEYWIWSETRTSIDLAFPESFEVRAARQLVGDFEAYYGVNVADGAKSRRIPKVGDQIEAQSPMNDAWLLVEVVKSSVTPAGMVHVCTVSGDVEAWFVELSGLTWRWPSVPEVVGDVKSVTDS